MTEKRAHFIFDILFVAVSVVAAVWLAKSGILERNLTGRNFLLQSFIAGLFFTSAFTTAPAIAALGIIAKASESVLQVALIGALGALIGDLIIFRFIRDRLSEDIYFVLGKEGKKVRHLFHIRLFRWLTFLFGGLIIASPLPDELGLALMGLSRTRASLLIPTSFIFNFTGILIISLIANAL